jgi:hypothetical protein
MLENPEWLKARGSVYHAYAVITMCRVLHALQHGTIVSKPTAARWTREAFPAWSPLIEQALIFQHGEHPGFLDETLNFINFVREQVKTNPAFQGRLG